MSRYLTIPRAADDSFTEKRSRFIACAWPVDTVDQAKQHVAELQRQYCDARHICWAWVIGTDANPQTYSTDNGEPSGTAGKPILGQINSRGLRNVVVAVVRYFGGIKLGTPGLIAAYRAAAALALDAAGTIEREEMTTLSLTFSYAQLNDVMRLIKTDGVQILSRNFDNLCALTLSLPLSLASDLSPRLSKIPTLKIESTNS